MHYNTLHSTSWFFFKEILSVLASFSYSQPASSVELADDRSITLAASKVKFSHQHKSKIWSWEPESLKYSFPQLKTVMLSIFI